MLSTLRSSNTKSLASISRRRRSPFGLFHESHFLVGARFNTMENVHLAAGEHGSAQLEQRFSKLSMVAMTFAILKYVDSPS